MEIVNESAKTPISFYNLFLLASNFWWDVLDEDIKYAGVGYVDLFAFTKGMEQRHFTIPWVKRDANCRHFE